MLSFSESIINEAKGTLCDKLTIALISIERINLDRPSEKDVDNIERAKIALHDAGNIAHMLHGSDLFNQVFQERRAEEKER